MHAYMDIKKSARISHDFWETTTEAGMFDIVAAAWASLPLLASGLLTDGTPPLMVFDKNAHFCLNAMKPNAVDEDPLTTIRHNDVDTLEDLCERHPPLLQRRLQRNIDLFDSLLPTGLSGDGRPIRFVDIGSEDATVRLARALLERGYHASPIFFPVIARGKAGLRLMLRANMSAAEIEDFCRQLMEPRDRHA
ncbi:hypothetical protein ACISU4_14290 [Streptomyces wuyuanensis]|uniref:hypothetical protein n=1 Tax=Streptomyces wuyuanensis TaxID=1196353 RepID=UPI00382334D0